MSETEIEALLAAHGGVNSTAGWVGSPNPADWHNIRRVCKCGDVIGWHDRSRLKSGQWHPISGHPFDAPHRAHVAFVLASTFAPDEPAREPESDGREGGAA